MISSTGRQLQLGDSPGNTGHEWFDRTSALARSVSPRTLEECEREHIISVLKLTKWKVSGENGAAQILDVIPTTLESKMKKLGIARPY